MFFYLFNMLMRYLMGDIDSEEIAAFIFVLLVCTSVTGVADAAQYDCWISRGIKYVAYVKTSFEWKTNSTQITSVDKDQIVSGICIAKGGITKVKSKSTKIKHVYDCKTKSIAGVELSGLPIGFSHTYKDRVTIYKDGDYAVDWDD